MDALRDESRSCRSSGEGMFCCPFICTAEKRSSGVEAASLVKTAFKNGVDGLLSLTNRFLPCDSAEGLAFSAEVVIVPLPAAAELTITAMSEIRCWRLFIFILNFTDIMQSGESVVAFCC